MNHQWVHATYLTIQIYNIFFNLCCNTWLPQSDSTSLTFPHVGEKYKLMDTLPNHLYFSHKKTFVLDTNFRFTLQPSSFCHLQQLIFTEHCTQYLQLVYKLVATDKKATSLANQTFIFSIMKTSRIMVAKVVLPCHLPFELYKRTKPISASPFVSWSHLSTPRCYFTGQTNNCHLIHLKLSYRSSATWPPARLTGVTSPTHALFRPVSGSVPCTPWQSLL